MMNNKIKHPWWFLGWFIFSALLLSGCSALSQVIQPKAEPTLPLIQPEVKGIVAEGRVVPKETANLFFVISGEVGEVLASEGDQVERGQVLARLSERETYEAALAAAELELLQAQQQLDDLKEKAALASSQALLAKLSAEDTLRKAQEQLEALDTDETQERIDDARQAVIDYQDDELKKAQEEYDKYKDLDAENTNRKNAEDRLEKAQKEYNRLVRQRDQLINDLELARERVNHAQAALEQAQRDYEARKDGPDPDQLALAEAHLKAAQAQVESAKAALERLDLRAPFTGRVIKVEISVGERVFPNQTVIVLADFSQWYVETTDLTENEVAKIALGQATTLLPDALPEVSLTGKVESISEYFIERAGDVTYTVRIAMDETDPRLRWGMTVEVRFEE